MRRTDCDNERERHEQDSQTATRWGLDTPIIEQIHSKAGAGWPLLTVGGMSSAISCAPQELRNRRLPEASFRGLADSVKRKLFDVYPG